MAERAKEEISQEIVELEAALPSDVMTRPIGELTPAEALARVSLKGLRRLDEIMTVPVTDQMDVREKRLIGDMAVAACKMFMRAAEGEFQARKAGALDELLAEIREAKAKRGLV
jgi:hypothetical protein